MLSLREVEQISDPALAAAAANALAKLRARLPPDQAHRLEHAVLTAKRFGPMPAPGIDPRALRRAAWAERSIRFDYTDAAGRRSSRTADPLSIVTLQQAHCLLAFCHLRGAYRSFRLDRMRNLAETGASFRPRRVPMLRDCLRQLRATVPSA